MRIANLQFYWKIRITYTFPSDISFALTSFGKSIFPFYSNHYFDFWFLSFTEKKVKNLSTLFWSFIQVHGTAFIVRRFT